MLRILVAVLWLLLCAQVGAQELFKCKDAAGKITYSSKECSQLGLSPGGEVTGRITVTPAIKPPPPAPPAPPPPPAAAAAAAKDDAKAGVAAKDPSVPPERRCFTINTAKGPATRCNDVPE